mgnify:CR=1 FL=1|jgi:D-3-phosphoglycerate dehydrogenase
MTTSTDATPAVPAQPRTEKFRILTADKLADEGVAFFNSQPDVEFVDRAGIKEDELAQIIGDFDGLIVRSGVNVTAKVLENPGRLKIVARAGVGVDNIDLAAATDKGVLVVNSAEASTITTAEHALALMFALARNIGPAYARMREGGWDRNKFQGRQLAGKTLGVVGFGRIGRTVAERALAMGMTVVAYDPFINAATSMDGKVRMFTNVLEMLPLADVLTFHVPLNDQTRNLLSAKTFPLCKKGVMIVNDSRGGVINENDLVEAINSGQVGGAALDVFEVEPLPADSPLRNHPKILITPHLGASTVEAQQAVSMDAAQSLLDYLRGKNVKGAVNAAGLRFDLDPLQMVYVDLAQRMAKLISPMITHGISSVTFELVSKLVSAAAPTIERMSLIGLLQPHMDASLNLVNVKHVAEQRGIKLQTVHSGQEKTTGQIILTVTGVPDADGKAEVRRIVGKVFDDYRPRVIEINRYHMDIVPAGTMVLIQNQDRPGVIGMVGTEFGQAGVNIADMAISRREDTALMVLKLDGQPPESLINRLGARPGILKIAVIQLPAESSHS